MSAASSPSPSISPSPRLSNLQDPTRLAQSYKTLLDEYAKVRAQNAVLKRALVEEQSVAKQLNTDNKVKDVELRKTKEDLDLYRLQAEKLSRTVKVLQEDLSSSSSRRRATKDGAAVREGLSEQQEDSIEQILEEFQKKSEQAETLQRDLVSERSRFQHIQQLLQDTRTAKDRLSQQLESSEVQLATLKSQLEEIERDRDARVAEYDDKLAAKMSAVRLVEARQLVIQAEILCVERRDEDAGKGVRGLKPLFGSLERILEACVAFAGHHGTNTTEYTTSDLELFRDRSRELLESVDIFDGVFAIPDAGGDEQSAAVRQLLRRVRELGELFGATLTVRSSHLDSVRNALGQYARRLERVAEELAEQGSPSAVSRAVWIESVRLFVDWFASFEDIVDKVPQAHREIDSVLELIVQSIRASQPDQLSDLLPLRSLFSALRSCVDDLDSALLRASRLSSDLARAQSQLDAVSAQLHACQSQTIPSLESKLAHSEAEAVRLQGEVKASHEKLNAETERLELDLALIGEETARLVRQVEELTTDKQNVENKLEQKTAELRDATAELDSLRTKSAEKENWARQLEADVKTLRKQLKERPQQQGSPVVAPNSAPAESPAATNGDETPSVAAAAETKWTVKATVVPQPNPLDGRIMPLDKMTRDQLEARVVHLSSLLQEADGKLFKYMNALRRLEPEEREKEAVAEAAEN